MTANSGPATNEPKTDDVEVSRAYLQGFDDAQDAIDQRWRLQAAAYDARFTVARLLRRVADRIDTLDLPLSR